MSESMALGDKFLSLQNNDFNNCIAFLKELKVNQDVFAGDSLALLKNAHQIAFTMGLWVQKMTEIPEWDKPYLQQLKVDSVQLLPSIILGNRRTLHLYERACIEDFLRYFYYFDHKIEHILLQSSPTKFQTVEFLINWIKDYPLLSGCEKSVIQSCNSLTSGYKELSRTVHGTIISKINLGDNLADLFTPIQDSRKDRALMRLIFGNIFFLFAIFHFNFYRGFTFDEMKLVCQHLTDKQKRIISEIE